MSNELFEHETEQRITREEAAKRLRAIADSLERHNQVQVVQHGRDVTIAVADEVDFEFEVEIEGDESEIEISISW